MCVFIDGKPVQEFISRPAVVYFIKHGFIIICRFPDKQFLFIEKPGIIRRIGGKNRLSRIIQTDDFHNLCLILHKNHSQGRYRAVNPYVIPAKRTLHRVPALYNFPGIGTPVIYRKRNFPFSLIAQINGNSGNRLFSVKLQDNFIFSHFPHLYGLKGFRGMQAAQPVKNTDAENKGKRRHAEKIPCRKAAVHCRRRLCKRCRRLFQPAVTDILDCRFRCCGRQCRCRIGLPRCCRSGLLLRIRCSKRTHQRRHNRHSHKAHRKNICHRDIFHISHIPAVLQ